MGSIIINDLVPIETRSIYQSYATVLFGLGTAIGAATGGAIADVFGWRWEFGIQIPAVAISLYITAMVMPRNLGLIDDRQGIIKAMRNFDYKGSLLLTTSMACLILGLVSSRQRGPQNECLFSCRALAAMSTRGRTGSLCPPYLSFP